MKKSKLRGLIEQANEAAEDLRHQVWSLQDENRKLTAQVAEMHEKWRPIPMVHEWTPRDPQCVFCDEPRDALRHRVDTPNSGT